VKIILETNIKKNDKTSDSLSVALESDEIVKIANSKGIQAANNAIDKFVQKYTTDLKGKLASVLKS